ncbi:MAG: recombinase family protein [Frankiales bacterium]|nr:recombinase family protein [Frankiales bacterium]
MTTWSSSTALIGDEVFEPARRLLTVDAQRSPERMPRPTARQPYLHLRMLQAVPDRVVAGQRAAVVRSRAGSQIKGLVDQLGGLITTVQRADPADRAEVYSELGLRMVYQPSRRVIKAGASPLGSCAKDRVRGGT